MLIIPVVIVSYSSRSLTLTLTLTLWGPLTLAPIIAYPVCVRVVGCIRPQNNCRPTTGPSFALLPVTSEAADRRRSSEHDSCSRSPHGFARISRRLLTDCVAAYVATYCGMDAPEDVAPSYSPYSSSSVRRKSESCEHQTIPQGTVMVLSIAVLVWGCAQRVVRR